MSEQKNQFVVIFRDHSFQQSSFLAYRTFSILIKSIRNNGKTYAPTEHYSLVRFPSWWNFRNVFLYNEAVIDVSVNRHRYQKHDLKFLVGWSGCLEWVVLVGDAIFYASSYFLWDYKKPNYLTTIHKQLRHLRITY